MKMMKVGAFVVPGVLVLVVMALAGEGFTTDPLDQVRARVAARRAVLVDVREQYEWNEGHLAGALLIPLSRLAEWERSGIGKAEAEWLTRAIPRGTTLYCHCALGGRAATAAEILRGLRYDARALRQGYEELLRAGFPKSTRSR